MSSVDATEKKSAEVSSNSHSNMIKPHAIEMDVSNNEHVAKLLKGLFNETAVVNDEWLNRPLSSLLSTSYEKTIFIKDGVMIICREIKNTS